MVSQLSLEGRTIFTLMERKNSLTLDRRSEAMEMLVENEDEKDGIRRRWRKFSGKKGLILGRMSDLEDERLIALETLQSLEGKGKKRRMKMTWVEGRRGSWAVQFKMLNFEIVLWYLSTDVYTLKPWNLTIFFPSNWIKQKLRNKMHWIYLRKLKYSV